MRFCTYVHLKPDGTPFYVGKGTEARARWKKRRSNPWHKNIVSKYGLKNIRSRIVKRFDCEKEAFAHEAEAIDCLKDFGYELTNLTNGGEGASGWKAPESTRALWRSIRKGRPGTPHSAETREHLSAMAKLRPPRFHTDQTKQKIRDSHKGKVFTEEHRANISKAAKKRRFSEEAKRLMGEQRKGRKHSSETKEKISLGNKLRWEKYRNG